MPPRERRNSQRGICRLGSPSIGANSHRKTGSGDLPIMLQL
jgi:hypothetical protein